MARTVIVAETAGFCFGVSRAVELVEEAVKAGGRVATLGPIIHNRHVVAHFEALGVRELSAPEQAQAGECVVIRSHGVSRAEYERLQATGARIVDATRTTMTVEFCDTADRARMLETLLRPYGIKEIVRTGVIAIEKGPDPTRTVN